MIKKIFVCTNSDITKQNLEISLSKIPLVSVLRLSIGEYLHNFEKFDVIHYYTSALEKYGVVPQNNSQIIRTGNKNKLCSYIVTSPNYINRLPNEEEALIGQIEEPLISVHKLCVNLNLQLNYAMHFDIHISNIDKEQNTILILKLIIDKFISNYDY